MSLNTQGVKAVFQQPALGLLIIRIALGGVMVMAGWNKFMAGKGTLSGVGSNIKAIGIHIGSDNVFTLFFGIMAAGAELVGGALLILGILFRLSAFFLTFTMLVATLTMYQSSGGDMSAYGYPMICFFVVLGLLFTGPGRFAICKD